MKTPFNVERLSFSSMASFARCPRSWTAKYVEKLQEVTTAPAILGTKIERCLAKRLNFKESEEWQVKDGKYIKTPLDLTKIEETDSSSILNLYQAQPWAWNSADEYQKQISISVDRWEFLAEKYGANPSIPFPLYGFADFIRRDTRTIMDLKTSARMTFKPNWISQIVLYALAEDLPNFEIHLLSSKSLKTARYQGTVTDELARSVMNEIAFRSWEIKGYINIGMAHIPEIPGWHCKFCVLLTNGKNCPRISKVQL